MCIRDRSGAGQYFTPRALIDVMTELIAPQPGEKCNDQMCIRDRSRDLKIHGIVFVEAMQMVV